MARRDYARAILQFKNACQAMPGDAEPYYQLGLAYVATHDYQAAAGALLKATELNPKHEGAQLKLSELMLATRNKAYITEATDRLATILGNSPGNVEAIDWLALGEWESGKADSAAKRLCRDVEGIEFNCRGAGEETDFCGRGSNVPGHPDRL